MTFVVDWAPETTYLPSYPMFLSLAGGGGWRGGLREVLAGGGLDASGGDAGHALHGRL